MKKISYGFVKIRDGCIEISIRGQTNSNERFNLSRSYFPKEICEIIYSFAEKNHTKIGALAIISDNFDEKLAEYLWLNLDIVPHFVSIEDFEKLGEEDIIQKVRANFNEDHSDNIGTSFGRVNVHNFLVSLDKIKESSSENHVELLDKLSKEFKEKNLKVGFFNSTVSGGGVALMRHSLIRLSNLLNLDIGWYVVSGNEEVFKITKQKIHNVLHGLYHEEFRLTSKDIEYYSDWTNNNAESFEDLFKSLNVFVIDDPQPSGLIKHIKKVNPDAKIIYRSHTQLDTSLINDKCKVQHDTWNFIHDNLKEIDLFASHPIENFVPKNVNKDKVLFMPPTTDSFDGLNKNIDDNSTSYYFELFNEMLEKTGQKALNPSEEYFIQVARFDPAKGIFDLIKAYKSFFEKIKKINPDSIPNLIIAGNGAYDDPEGLMIYNQVLDKLNEEKYSQIKDYVKVAIVPFRDQLLNVLIRKSFVSLQLSHREGYEVKVTEALMKMKPVITYNSGGLPLQVKDNINGFVVENFNTDKVSEYMLTLYQNRELHKEMSENAINHYDKNISTIKNLINWLYLTTKISEDKDFRGKFKDINELIEEDSICIDAQSKVQA
ncbi:glycosyltransferase [Candidatus Pacearchaeota archaeon]|nr:glycosyltransferase [Candidatus Pacearchaeota archaeon]